MKSISFFNNKGGVGKTTLLCNFAAYVSLELGKKVLVVDADPQCNATQAMFSDLKIEDIYQKNGFTIYDVVKPLSSGRGFSKDLQITRSSGYGVDVLPGDPQLSLTEDLLAQDWNDAAAGKPRGIRTTLLFVELLTRCDDYDYVLFDMGPSLGSINRSVLLATDFFLSPMSIDIFSLKAIENISYAIKKWKKQIETGIGLNDDPEEVGLDYSYWRLKFLGYVTQQYTAKTDSHGQRRPVKAFERIMKKMPKEISRHFVDVLQPSLGPIDYNLGSIPTLHSLIPLSQTSRKPIFKLKAADGVVGAHFTKVKEYRKIIEGIVGNALRNLETIK